MEPGIKIAICDDEAVCRESIEMMCRAFFEGKNHSVGMPDIHVFSSGKEITASSEDYDILLLDIEMPKQDGISIKEYFEKTENRQGLFSPPVIRNGYWKHLGRM